MGRHHKAAVLSSSSSTSAGFNRNPVKRFIWWSTKILSVFQLAGIVLFITCFLWCLWRLPQDYDAYPDGLTPCPASSHKIVDESNVTIRCKTCTECPAGQQLVPPCGSTTQSETSIECRSCQSGSYKEGHGTGRCRPCQACGLQQTICQCTSEKNTQCGECPRGYYQEDYTMDSCKKCSLCCGIKRFAEFECIYLKQCKRTNCTQQMGSEGNRVPTVEKIARMDTTQERIALQREITHQRVSQIDNSEGARNRVLQDIVSQLKKTKFRREVVNMPIQSAGTYKYATKLVQESTTLKDDTSNLQTTASVDGDGTASLQTVHGKLQDGLDTVPDNSVLKPTLPLTSSYSSSFKSLLIILIVLVSIAVVALILIAALIARKRQPGHLPGSGCTITCCARIIYLRNGEYLPVLQDTAPQTEWEQEISRLSDNMVNTSEERYYNDGADDGDLQSLALSDISIDLENNLIKKLDVQHKREYGWQKVGRAFEIDKGDLEYLKTAYKRPVESPTKELLEILKSKNRTVGELINKLESSKVNRPDVASLIRQHIATARSLITPRSKLATRGNVSECR